MADRPAGNRASANRENAARSTGPASAAGKARASRNALGQGLFAGIEADGLLTGRARKLAARLTAQAAGPAAGEHVQALAEAVAQRSVEISHIRALRQAAFLAAQLRAASGGTLAHSAQTLAALTERFGADTVSRLKRFLAQGERDLKDESERTTLALRNGLKRLAALDHHEARMLSARTQLIRRLDAERGQG